MRRLIPLIPLAGVLIALAVFALPFGLSAHEPVSRPIVIAELFTSEGCSSCPPADDVLRQLESGGLSDTADIVAIGEHVDYWDRLGWRDPFSSPLYSARQSEYDRNVFRTNRIYTPQLVFDGTYECVGSDVDAVRRAMAAAARQPKATVIVSAERAGAARLRAHVRADVPASLKLRGTADVIVAVTETRLVSRVRRGENGGRTLTHAAVARMLTTIGSLAPGERSYSADTEIAVAPEWQLANVRVVAFVQERDSRRIVGGGATPRGPGDRQNGTGQR